MVVDSKKESINVNKLVCEKEEIINVEEDMIVPDSKPDILSTISTSGTICVYKKELIDEKLKIDGSINTYIMYIADNTEDRVRGINVNLDFSKLIDAPNCNADMIYEVSTEIKSIDCSVINGRKINVKSNVVVKFKVYTNENIEMINEIIGNDDIQMLKNNLNVNSLVGWGKTKAYVKDTINIEATDNLAEILKVNINMVDTDIKTSYDKVLAKTEAEIKIIYLTEDNRLVSCTNKIPIVGFIDIQDVSEENICDINFSVRNMVLKPNSVENHSIYFELEVEVTCMAYASKELNLVQDLYSPTQELTCVSKKVTTMTKKENRTETCQISENINIPGIIEGELIDEDCVAKITNINKRNSKIIYEGEIEINFIFGEMDSRINTARASVPFEFTISGIEDIENINLFTNTEIKKQDFVIKTGGDITADLEVVFNTNMSKNDSINVIENVEITNEKRSNEDYSLVIYIVKPGDSLWSIAKKLGSTVEDIVKANAIENENMINVGQKLYIPKYSNRGTKEQEVSSTMIYA